MNKKIILSTTILCLIIFLSFCLININKVEAGGLEYQCNRCVNGQCVSKMFDKPSSAISSPPVPKAIRVPK